MNWKGRTIVARRLALPLLMVGVMAAGSSAQAFGPYECVRRPPTRDLRRAESALKLRWFRKALRGVARRVKGQVAVVNALKPKAQGLRVERTRRALSVAAAAIVRTRGYYGRDGRRDKKPSEHLANLRWAVATLGKLTTINPKADHAARYAEGLAQVGEHAEALQHLERLAAARKTLERESWMALAALRAKSGDVQGAQKATAKCLSSTRHKRLCVPTELPPPALVRSPVTP